MLATAPAMGMTMVMVTEMIMEMVMEMGIEEKEQAKMTATALAMVMATVQLLRRMMDGNHLSTCKAAWASQRWPKSSIFTDTEINLDLKVQKEGKNYYTTALKFPDSFAKPSKNMGV